MIGQNEIEKNKIEKDKGGIRTEGLSVIFHLPDGDVCAADDISARFEEGKITGLIGESGCGKSVLGLALLGLLPPYASVEGKIYLDGEALNPGTARKQLGTEIGLIPQNPSESLNPARTVGAHLMEALLPVKAGRKEKKERAEKLLRDFGFPETKRIWRAYPHELSGGMQQRVLCAIGAACSPRWILADEPTKGLDSDLRWQVKDTLLSLRSQGVRSMLVITHDLPLARELCDTIVVMYAGKIMESGSDVLKNPLHPYTKAFLAALPEHGFQSMPGTALRTGEKTAGCPFASRCAQAEERCRKECPPPVRLKQGRIVRCFQYV